MKPSALDLLPSAWYDGALAPEHAADLAKSGLTEQTIREQHIRSVPLTMIPQLLGFNPKKIISAYLIPFPDPAGGWLPHIRLKVFPRYTDRRGRTVKYLGPAGVPPRLFLPLATLGKALAGDDELFLVEGCKKALSAAQLGLPAVGLEGIQGWHVRGSRALLDDFEWLHLRGRPVAVVPDGDVSTNSDVARGAVQLGHALEALGASPRLLLLPAPAKAAA